MDYKISIRQYGKNILSSIPIQLCSKDFLVQGDCVFDVGAHKGALSIAFSRLVGKSGIVHAFEPNPYLIPVLEQFCQKNNATNVKIHNVGIWSSSKKNVKFYCAKDFQGQGSSFIVNSRGSEEVHLDVISLDEFSTKNNAIPNFLKIDAEGADYHVLAGATNILKNYHPIIIFEYFYVNNEKNDCIKFLEKFGYRFLDVSLYQEVNRAFYQPKTRSIQPFNILAIQPKLFSDYFPSIKIEEEEKLIPNKNFKTNSIELKKGRYILTFHFQGPSNQKATLRIRNKIGNILDMRESTIDRLKHYSNSNLILELNSSVKVFCELITDDYSGINFKNVTISKIAGLD